MNKTEYYMRISDWSADVCCSDVTHLLLHKRRLDSTRGDSINPDFLRREFERPAACEMLDRGLACGIIGQRGAGLAAVGARHVDDQAFARLEVGERRCAHHARIDHIDFENGGEIGRASCRERLCQYV